MSLQPTRRSRRASRRATVLVLLAALAVAVALAVRTYRWRIPESARALRNPVAPTPATLAQAKPIYERHCANCHGAAGDGRGDRAENLGVAPTDFTNGPRLNRRTDGELFWIIANGHRPMPAFEKKLNETQRWELVNYVRQFAAPNSHSGGR